MEAYHPLIIHSGRCWRRSQAFTFFWRWHQLILIRRLSRILFVYRTPHTHWTTGIAGTHSLRLSAVPISRSAIMPDIQMLEPIKDALRWVVSTLHLPTSFSFKRPHFNFITVHYMYMIGWAIVGSIMLFPPGLLSYTDSLFFAAGATTQSGLNTVDVNTLYLYQQVILMLVACVCNPIFINTVVVFVRLYWFEKRFKHIVREARNSRKTISRNKSQIKEEEDMGKVEAGVNGRHIKVLHHTTKPNGMSGTAANPHGLEKEFKEKMGLDQNSRSVTPTPPSGSVNSSAQGSSQETAREDGAPDVVGDKDEDPITKDPTGESEMPHHLGLNHSLANRDIKFADELPEPASNRRDSSPEERIPEPRQMSQHIAFVERQRQQKNQTQGTATLRIPGPRDFDRGDVPKELDSSEDHDLIRPPTRNTLNQTTTEHSHNSSDDQDEKQDRIKNRPRRGITIDIPDHPAHREREQTIEEEDEGDDQGRLRNSISKLMSPIKHRRTRSGGVNISDRKSTVGRTFTSLTTARSRDRMEDPMPYLSWQPTLGRNSQFVNLTAEQREELGGVEYRALKTLAKILIGYFVGFHILGMVVLLPWIIHTHWSSVPAEDGVNPAWWGVFTPASMFNDLGFTLTPDSMISFNTATLPLLLGSYLIIIGNTGFPCMLRFTIWVFSKLVPYGSSTWEELRFLLDHPRRCFTLLFPSKATWWLFWILVLLNGIDLIFFIILDLNDETVTSLPPGFRVLDGWFQAASTRTAGFACVNLADLHPAIQVSYLIMMYISVFPIAISVRRTNVYEEKSLGIWGGEEAADMNEPSYVGQHLRRQLSFDLWYVFLGFFIICIVEGDRLGDNGQYAFTMFAVLFEIVSAYGTVGLSLGYPTINASFSAEFRTISKLVIIAMMIRGRHRGLPYALDRAILLPSENLHKKEAEDATRRHERRNSIFVDADDAGLARRTTALQTPGSLNRRQTWEDGELDENGLPKQHLAMEGVDPMMAPGMTQRTLTRRGSGFSTVSKMEKHKHERSRSLAQFVAGGLSAGPTFSKEGRF